MKKPSARSGGPSQPPDEDLWHLATSTVEPLKKRKGRYHPAAGQEATHPPAGAAPAPRAKRASKTQKESTSERATTQVSAEAPGRSAAVSTLAEFNRRSMRKIRAGRLEIEARIDLHGMRQDEAHEVLRAFLLRAYERGLRYVLVITGKGRSASSRAEDEGPRERGVLKRNVPRWLAEPQLARIVVSHTEAAIRHGGEGALYVHVRSKTRRDD